MAEIVQAHRCVLTTTQNVMLMVLAHVKQATLK